MMGHKAGDNSQILALAEGLGWPFEIKHLVYRPTELLTNLLAPLTLLGIVRRKSSPLAPPWPDLIISAGRRNEPPCRWIQARAAADGARPAGPRRPPVGADRELRPGGHDPAVPPAGAPERPAQHHAAAAGVRSAPRGGGGALGATPCPPAAAPYRGDGRRQRRSLRPGPRGRRPARARRERVRRDARTARCWSPPVPAPRSARSRRSRRRSTARPRSSAGPAMRAAENPYLGYLALADSFIVTCESMSMLTEACATRKPVYMFDLHTGPENSLASARASGRQGRQLMAAAPPAGARAADHLPHRVRSRADAHDPGRAHHPPPADRRRTRGLARRELSAGTRHRRSTTWRARWRGSRRCSRKRQPTPRRVRNRSRSSQRENSMRGL